MSYELNEEDKKRISHHRDYQYAKRMHESFLEYENVEIGEVYLIKYTFRDNSRYICHYGKRPTKFFVVHKDEGFVFAKRISANGKLGKEVICLTTAYPLGADYALEPDPTYLDSILLGESYDIAAEGKRITKAKGKARTRNNKKVVNFKDPDEAYDHMSGFKVGDMLWTANTTYGEKLVGWQVTKVSIAPTCLKWGTKAYPWQPSFKVRGSTHEDRLHNEYGYKSTIIVELTATVNTKNTRRHSKDITFYDLYNTSKYSRWYKEKPVTVEDMLGE